jgi:hypothetical protein
VIEVIVTVALLRVMVVTAVVTAVVMVAEDCNGNRTY